MKPFTNAFHALARKFRAARRVRTRGLQNSARLFVGRVPSPGVLTSIQDQCEKCGLTAVGQACWLAVLLVGPGSSAAAGLAWPANRLLPAFSTPAATIDCIELTNVSGPEVDLFVSLEGLVNRVQPHLACVANPDQEGETGWLTIHRLHVQRVDGFDAVEKYQGEIHGLVVVDPARPETLNLATTLAGLDDALICDPSLLPKLTQAPFHLKIVEDLRGRFSTRDEVYDFLLKEIWPRCSHRIIAGLSPRTHGDLRDLLVAVNAAVFWLDPKIKEDAAVLARFVPSLQPAHALYVGWWPDEDAGLKWIGQFGIPVLASDFFQNASLFGGVPEKITPLPVAPPPPLQNRVYVACYLSDGDNVQYMQHSLKRLWADPARGRVPIGWTVSPLAADLDPAMLQYYYRTATTNDCLVSGPSGAGYARLDFWKPADLDAFTKITNPYLERSGLRIITVWLRVDDAIGNSFGANCPALLGLMSHAGGSREQLFGALPMMGFVEGANYANSVAKLHASLDEAAKDWNGTAPKFLAVQASAWRVPPSGLAQLAEVLDTNKFVLVRPDHWFQLYALRQQSRQTNK